MIKYPSCPPPLSLPGWRSQPGSAFGNWHTGHFSSRSIWRAGRLPRQLCWQLLLSLSCAGAEDTPLGLPPLEDPCPVRVWALGTAWGAPVLTQNLPLLPPKCGAVNPSKAQLTPVVICACFSGCQCLCMFSSEVPERFTTSLIPADGKCKVTCRTQG